MKNKTSWIQIRCTQKEKSLIVGSLRKDEKISAFMLSCAKEEVMKRAGIVKNEE